MSEGPFDVGLDWRKEVASARRARADAEADSRTPEQLLALRKAARDELGAAGAPALAAKTEQLRDRWVADRMVELGRARAASVGWPDAYAYTKSLGEQALVETRGAVPVNIVRPSIIESSWSEPAPGLDPRLPHGRADPHLLRPGPAQAVPRRARGRGRRHPGRPRGRRSVHGRRARARRGASHRPCGLWYRQPAEVPLPRRQREELVRRAPRVRLARPAHRRQRVRVRRPGQGAGPAEAGHQDARDVREGAPFAAAAGQAGRVVGRASRSAGSSSNGPTATSSSTAATPSARRCTRSTTCSRWRSR